MTDTPRSALIFGARNLGPAIIEALVAQGWNVAGAARSDETLANISAAGALALRSDITDQVVVRATVEEAAEALGAMHLVVNAAAAYGGTRTGPFGGGPIADAAPDAFDSWSVAPARAAFAFLSGAGGAAAALDRAATLVQVTGGSARGGGGRAGGAGESGPRAVGGGGVRRARDHAGGGARAARPRHPRGAADRRRGHRAVRRRRSAGRRSRGAGRPAAGRRRRRVPRRAGTARGDARAAGDAAGGELGAVAGPDRGCHMRSRAARSSSSSAIRAAAMFSWRCPSDEVPGMSKTCASWCRSQASAIWAGVAACFAATPEMVGSRASGR